MGFRFPLQTLLRLREGVERQEELKLQRALSQLARARKDLERLQQARQAAWAEAQQRLTNAAPASELHFEVARDEVMQMQAETLRARIQELEEAARQQQIAYRKARQEREILENLRDRQREHYQIDQNRREQQAIDDVQQMLRSARGNLEAEEAAAQIPDAERPGTG